MNILAISDLHGNLNDLDINKNIDVVVIAGDFAQLRGNSLSSAINSQITWINNTFIPWLKNYSNIKFVIIPGNHDMIFDPKIALNFGYINMTIKWPKNVHFLVNSGCTINNVKFYGTPNIPIISYSWAFESDHDTLKKEFSKIPENIDVLITHTPPHIDNNSKIDRSIQYGASEAFGSNELAEEIYYKKPKYVFCGHIHSGDHSKHIFEKSEIYNVSRLDEHYQIAYEPTIIKINN